MKGLKLESLVRVHDQGRSDFEMYNVAKEINEGLFPGNPARFVDWSFWTGLYHAP